MRKKLLALLTLVAVIIMCTGCFNVKRTVTKKSIDTSYSEWVEEIGLLDGEYLIVRGYVEREDGLIDITVDYNYGEKEQALEELSELIDKNNAFVQNHPKYFSSEAYVSICFYNTAGAYEMCFFSKGRNNRGMYVSGADLGRIDGMTINYASIDMRDGYKWVTDYDVTYNVPVVFLWNYDCKGLTAKTYRILGCFNGIEQVLLGFSSEYDGYSIDKNYIQNYAPGV